MIVVGPTSVSLCTCTLTIQSAATVAESTVTVSHDLKMSYLKTDSFYGYILDAIKMLCKITITMFFDSFSIINLPLVYETIMT